MNSPQNTNSVALRGKRWRFNPLSNLQPSTLARHLDAFEAGYLRDAALVWDALEKRDDLLRTVISKRKKSVARHGWTVLPLPDLSPSDQRRAAEHVEALEYFYNHLQCDHAVDRAERGGFKLLARQMMDAVGKCFAVHEIVWNALPHLSAVSGTTRRFVTAHFRFVPLAFFENTTGQLRFLESDFAQEGRDLDPGAWMVTAGDGLMIASSTAWMFKHISLDDWLQCSQRNGTPAIKGISAAARGSAEWTALEEAVSNLLSGQSIVHSVSDSVQVLDLMAGGGIPFPQLVERIDRMLAALWRGADLSTISRERGYGASLQEKEVCALEEDDAEMLTETLNRYVDEWVIRHVFGANEKPLARVKVLVSPRECTTADLQIDEFLLRNGGALSVQETFIRYGRALPKPGEKVFVGIQSKASLPESSQNIISAEVLENEGLGCGPSVSFRGCSPAISRNAQNPEPSNTDKDSTVSDPHLVAPERASSPALRLENNFILLQEDWIQLSPYGDFPHVRGVQRVDRAAVDEMVAQFNSFRGRLGRLFGGVPFYVGHPDLPGASEVTDRKAYGWIMQIEPREDGLYGQVMWSDAGMELLRNAHYKFYSPYWEAREIGTDNGRRLYRPVALISVGLTNQPNIPVRPLANENVDASSTIQESALLASSATDSTNRLDRIENIVFPPMHTASRTEGLGRRKSEMARIPNRRDRIQECVLSKMQLGLTYNEAWENVKREHAGWFREAGE